ncbi:MAG: GTPase Era [Betaproteobacteria bacterium]|nr:GTPase Era [Betaproteobacteria bacterium]
MSAAPFRAGTVAIVGRPNVGKSTLLNQLVGAHVSITSRKAQTTRHRIQGIRNDGHAQLVFVDTPGFQKRYSNALNRAMNRSVTSTLAGVDAIVLVVDAWERDDRDDAVLALVPAGVPVVLALNKVDRVKDRAKLARLLADWASKHDFAALVPVSAEKGTQVKALADEVAKLLPESAPLHGPDELTDRPERFLAAELVREKLFRLLGDELPYTAAVVIDEFKEEGALRRISATIYVDRQGHKAIVIGEKGATLKRIGTEARVAMEELFGGKVFLELWVKVKSGWADSEATVRQWGYE